MITRRSNVLNLQHVLIDDNLVETKLTFSATAEVLTINITLAVPDDNRRRHVRLCAIVDQLSRFTHRSIVDVNVYADVVAPSRAPADAQRFAMSVVVGRSVNADDDLTELIDGLSRRLRAAVVGL